MGDGFYLRFLLYKSNLIFDKDYLGRPSHVNVRLSYEKNQWTLERSTVKIKFVCKIVVLL